MNTELEILNILFKMKLFIFIQIAIWSRIKSAVTSFSLEQVLEETVLNPLAHGFHNMDLMVATLAKYATEKVELLLQHQTENRQVIKPVYRRLANHKSSSLSRRLTGRRCLWKMVLGEIGENGTGRNRNWSKRNWAKMELGENGIGRIYGFNK